MSTSVNEPFLLSTYTLPKRFARPTSHAVSNVYATHQHASTSTAEGYVTVAAQGDGVHILDLSTLHPVVSHTLGPSTAFSCPSATRINGKTCTTYAVLEASQGAKPEERGRTVRMWRDTLSGEASTTGAQVTATTVTLPHRISEIAVPDELEDRVLFVGSHGEITVTDLELATLHSHTFEEEASLLKSFVFSRSEATFVPKRWGLKDGAVAVTLVKTSKALRLRIVGVDSDGLRVVADLALPSKLQSILDASCSTSGFVSVMTPSGEWHSFQIESPDFTAFVFSTPSAPITVRGLSFNTSPHNEATSPFTSELSLLSLGSSHVLVAGITTASTELAFLLWDLQYSVLLASRTMNLPASVYRAKKHGIQLRLSGSPSRSQHALLTLLPIFTPAVNGDAVPTPGSDESAQRSSILAVPLTVPSSSSVANALGRASATEKWLIPSHAQASGSSSSQDAAQAKVVRGMRTAMEQKRVEAADDVFFAWVAQQQDGPRASAKLPLGYQFVKGVLEVVFRVPKNATDIPYSPKVVRHLMQQRCVSSGMVDGGLFAALRLRQDWESMMLALKTVVDIPEADVISFLHASASASLQKQADDNAMQVDTAAPADGAVPALPAVLALCTTYTMSAPALRLALRQHLPGAAELTAVLEVLAGWVAAWCDADVPLLPERTKKDAHGALVAVLEPPQPGALPPLEKVLAFAQTLLDASFLTFLTHAPAHAALRALTTRLAPELAFADDVLAPLRGPLEPFVRAHARAVHEAAHGAQKPDPRVDWRRRRKEAHEQAGMAVGVYQVEELVL